MVRIEMQTLTTFEFDEAFVWPDGEPQPTAAKVGEQFTECELGETISWLVGDGDYPAVRVRVGHPKAIEVDVPNPAYAGDDVLFGDPPPKTIVDRVEL